MKTIEEVRLQRLQMLRDEFGTLSALNARLGLSARDSTLSQILNKSQKGADKKPASLGSNLARKLEAATGKPTGWMDNDPAFDAQQTAVPFADLNGFEGQLIAFFRRLPPDQQHAVLVELNSLAERAGNSAPSPDNPFPGAHKGPDRRSKSLTHTENQGA